MAQVVVGVRRSGKSTLCYLALQHSGVKYAYVDFDDERLINLSADQLSDVLEVLYNISGEFNYPYICCANARHEWYIELDYTH